MRIRKHILLAVLFFALATFIGLLLRLFVIWPIGIPYKYLVHTHSHIALLGWVYLALTSLIYGLYLNVPTNTERYRYLFWFTQLTLVGMLVTFPIQGYGLFSILFSTLFLVASYWFFGFFRRYADSTLKQSPAFRCIDAGLWYMVVSSLGPWALGGIMNTLGPTSVWYRMAIYFYLHFQYNGWMMMALLGIFLFSLSQNGFSMSRKTFTQLFWCANVGIVLSFFLSTLWIEPSWPFYLLGGMGALLQLLVLFLLLKWLLTSKYAKSNGKKPPWLGIVLFSLVGFKLLLQLASAHPVVAELAATVLDFTVGYLHLVFLGIITVAIFMLAEQFGWLKISKWAMAIYLFGFFASEFLIVYRALTAWLGFRAISCHTELLAVASGLIALGLIVMISGNYRLEIEKTNAS